MPFLVGLVAFILATLVLIFLFRVLVLALPFGLLAAAGGVAVLAVTPYKEVRELLGTEDGATLLRSGLALRIDLSQGLVVCNRNSARQSAVAEEIRGQSSSPMLASFCAGSLYIIMVLTFLNAWPDHWLLHWNEIDFSKELTHAGVVLGLLVIAPGIIGVVLYTWWRHVTPKLFDYLVMEEARAYESRFRAAVSPRLRELSHLIEEIERSSAWTGFAFPTDADSQIGDVVERLRIDVLRNPERLNELVEDACGRCRADLASLGEAKNFYTQAMQAFEDAKREVLRTGSAILLGRLEPAHEAIGSKELLGLVPSRRWADFKEIVMAMTADINVVKENACRFNASNDQTPPSVDDAPTSLDQAYRTLGVPPTASDDQVKRVWRTLAAAWHPDAGAVTDDGRFKALSRAYELIRQARRLA